MTFHSSGFVGLGRIGPKSSKRPYRWCWRWFRPSIARCSYAAGSVRNVRSPRAASRWTDFPGCFLHTWGPWGHSWRSFPAHLGPWEVISGTLGSLGALWELRGVTFCNPGPLFEPSGALLDGRGYLVAVFVYVLTVCSKYLYVVDNLWFL